MELQLYLQLTVQFLHVVHCVRDFLHGLQLLVGPADLRVHSLLGVQPVDGVLQHVVKLLCPVRKFGLRVLPVSLKSVDYKKNKQGKVKLLFLSIRIIAFSLMEACILLLLYYYHMGLF